MPAKKLERVGESLCLGAVFDDGCLVVSCQPPALHRFVVFFRFFCQRYIHDFNHRRLTVLAFPALVSFGKAVLGQCSVCGGMRHSSACTAVVHPNRLTSDAVQKSGRESGKPLLTSED